MASVIDQFLPSQRRALRKPLRGRALALVIVVLVHLLLALLLLLITPPGPKKRNDNTPSVFILLPDAEPQRARKAAARAKPAVATPKPSTTPIPPPEKPTEPTKPVIFGELAYNAVDISKIPSVAPPGAADAGTGQDADDAKGVGVGPGGVTLYKAEWAREPTNAELSFYMPRNQPDDSWGMIACRTVPRNLVEDCVALDDWPHGSGIARALVNAAWQFKVRPPRINGKAQVGEWVRIRIDFSSKNNPE